MSGPQLLEVGEGARLIRAQARPDVTVKPPSTRSRALWVSPSPLTRPSDHLLRTRLQWFVGRLLGQAPSIGWKINSPQFRSAADLFFCLVTGS